MTTQPQWTADEFAMLMASAELTAGELSGTHLPQRSPGAIEVVRHGVHLYHLDHDTHNILSRSMIAFLGSRPRLASTMCAVCLQRP